MQIPPIPDYVVEKAVLPSCGGLPLRLRPLFLRGLALCGLIFAFGLKAGLADEGDAKPESTVAVQGLDDLNPKVTESDDGTIRVAVTVPPDEEKTRFFGITKKIVPPRPVTALSFSISGIEEGCIVHFRNDKDQTAYRKANVGEVSVDLPSLTVKGSGEVFEGNLVEFSIGSALKGVTGEREIIIENLVLQ